MKKISKKIEKEFKQAASQFIARIMAEGAIEEVKVMPIDLQISILKKTERYFKEGKFAQDSKTVPRKYLNSAAKCLHTLLGQMERTVEALQGALTVIHAEQDARDIGTEPSDKILVKDQKRRQSRLERYRSRIQKKGEK
jgi:hypothetical protein